MESQNYLAAINDTLNVLIQRFEAMEARQDSSDARFEKLYCDFVDKCDMDSHPPFIKMASPISLVKSNQVVRKLQSFHEEKIRAREKVDEFFSQYRPRYKPKSDPCLRPKLAKFKKVRNKHHNDKQREASVPILGFQSLLPAKRLLLDSICFQGFAFFVSNVQKSNCTDYGYERVGSVKEKFKSPDFSISDGIAIDFSIRFDVGFILDAKQILIPAEVVGVHLGHNVFDELPHSTNNCVLQLGYHMPISDSGGTLRTGHFTSKFQVKDAYNFKFLVCDGEFLKNDTTDLQDEIKLVVSNFCDKKSDESKIMAVGFVGLYQFMNAQPSILGNACQKELVGMYGHHVFFGMQQTVKIVSLKLCFREFIRDKGGTKFLSSFESMDLWASCEDSWFCVDIDHSMGYYCKGIRLFEMMRTSNFTVDSLVYEVLLQSLCKNLRLDDAIRVLEEMMETGLTSPNNVFAVVVYVFCKLGKVDDVMKFLEDKKIMETSACNVLLQGCCSTGKFLMAEDLLVKMYERNVADCISWNIVIRWLSENARIREVLELLGRKVISCSLPDCDTYSALVVCHCKMSNYRNAMDIFDHIRAKSWVLDHTSYSELVKGLCLGKMTLEATEVFCYMSSNRCSIEPSLFNMLIKCLCETGEVDEAIRIQQLAYYSGTSSTSSTYSTIMLGLSKLDRVKDMWVVLSKMLVEGFRLDLDAYYVLIQSLRLQNRMKECLLLFNMMVDEGIRDKGGGSKFSSELLVEAHTIGFISSVHMLLLVYKGKTYQSSYYLWKHIAAAS